MTLSTSALQVDGVVVISPFHWNFRDDIPGTTHHIAREFSSLAPTIFVEPPAQWNPGSEHFRFHRLPSTIVGSATAARDHLTVMPRRALPLGRFAGVQAFDSARNASRLRRLLTDHGIRRPLLWHSFPYGDQAILDAVPHHQFVYHCLDYTKRETAEARLVRDADAVFSVSEPLVKKHRSLNSASYLLPNGVDLDIYNFDRASRTKKPSDLPRGRQLIGFLGCINHHLDLELLLEVARTFTTQHLAIVGRVATNETAPGVRQKAALEELRDLPNVSMLGFKPTNEVPAYLHAFDVCLIPFLDDEFNQDCDPLKFYEYAAIGKTVVSTNLPVARRYPDLCYHATTRSDFIDQLGKALDQPPSSSLIRARLELARSHSWKSLVARAVETLGALEPRIRG